MIPKEKQSHNSRAFLPALSKTIEQLISEFDRISVSRKSLLAELTSFIESKVKSNQKISLNFICTHNSRRSHLAQVWAQTAAYYYNIPNVECFSGGTEATAFNFRAVKAMEQAGFNISKIKDATNPVYEVRFSEAVAPLLALSKKYDDPVNPGKDFAAIMTCSHADENCPLVLGATTRIAITYDDPKDFDGTAQEEAKYIERVHEIGREILFAFSGVKI
jgi:arsenate reductase (thioredoxin)